MNGRDTLSIGEFAARSGVAASTLRYYESIGLLAADRRAYQRRYPRSALRRVSVIRAAQALGLPLSEIAAALAELPADRAPSPDDWARMAERWRDGLDRRIETLLKLRDDLDACIGCGCLSLERCALYNREDAAARRGAGPRYLMGDRPDAVDDADQGT
jgi:MerR family redox-sensitive transcriptional activator SoxR